MSARQVGLGLLIVAVIALAAGAPEVLAWLRGTDGAWQPPEVWQAGTFGAVVAAVGALVLGPALSAQLKAAVRATPQEFAAQLCAAWPVAPETCDALVLAMVRRNHALLRAEWDAMYRDVMLERLATTKQLAEVVGAVNALRPLPETMRDLADGVKLLGVEMKAIAGVVERVESQNQEHARAIADTREELAAYAGPNRRVRDRRAPPR